MGAGSDGTNTILAEVTTDQVGIRLRSGPDNCLMQEIFDRAEPAKVLLRSAATGLEDVGHLMIPSFTEFDVEPASEGGGILILRSASLGGKCTATISVPAKGRAIHVDITLSAVTAPAASVVYEFEPGRPDVAFSPHLRPASRDVISRWGMKTPACLLQAGTQLCGVIGDVGMLEAMRADLPLILEMDCDREHDKPPVVGMGIRPHTHHSLYCFETPTRLEGSPPLGSTRFAFYLYANATAQPKKGFAEIARYVWQEFGHPRFDNVKPQVVGFDRYARLGFGYASENLWESMEGGRGGVRSGVRYQNDVWFQTLFNHLRSGIAFKIFGKRWSDRAIEEMGDRIKRLALSAPQTAEGLFPTIFEAGIEQAMRVERWHKANHWMTSPLVERSMRKVLPGNPVKLVDWDNTFHLVDNSWQGYWMLRWHREVEADPSLVGYCERYAEYLVSLQQTSGAFPSFLHGDELRVGQLLMHNVGSAASAAFLVQLYLVTKNGRWLESAMRTAQFVERDVLSTRCWQDYEVIFDSKGKPLGMFDRHTGQYAQVTQGMMWSAAMYQALEEATPGSGYLALAEEVVDYLTLYQQMWNPPFLSVQTFGGFPVGNGHPGWNDGRTSMVAQVLLDQYHVGRRRDHLERGIAALRTSLVLMFMPENSAVSPWALDGAVGNSDMSYGGRGVDERWCGYTYDFPVGPALTGYAMALNRYGDIYVDAKQGFGIGINGFQVSHAAIEKGSIDLSLRASVRHEAKPILKIENLNGCDALLTINGRGLGRRSAQALSAGILIEDL